MKKLLIILSVFLLTGCTINDTSLTSEETVTKEDVVIDEQGVINYFNDSKTKINDYLKDPDNNKVNIKNIVVTIVDFLFYDGEINNTKFSDLKYETRLKIVDITKDIDKSITLKWPTYKEDISSTTNEVIKDLTNQLDILSNRIQKQIEENVPQETQDIVNDKANELGENGKETFDELKDIYNTAKEKIKDWYEKYRG